MDSAFKSDARQPSVIGTIWRGESETLAGEISEHVPRLTQSHESVPERRMKSYPAPSQQYRLQGSQPTWSAPTEVNFSGMDMRAFPMERNPLKPRAPPCRGCPRQGG
jgi:hypothetical protein